MKTRLVLLLLAVLSIVGCKHDASKLKPHVLGATASTVGTSALTILGCQSVSNPTVGSSLSLQCEQATDWVAVSNNATATIWSFDLASQDTDDVSVDVRVKNVGGTTVYDHAQFQLAFGGTYGTVDGGSTAFADPSGSTSSRTTYSNVGSALTNTTASLSVSGGSLSLQVTCHTTGAYCVVRSSASVSKGSQELAVLAVSPTSAQPATATTVTVTTTPGAAQIATSVSIGSTPLLGCVATNDHTITCTTPTTSTAGGPYAVNVSSSNATLLPLPSAFTFTSITQPVLSSISVNAGPNAGGQSVTLTGSHFTGTTSVSFGSASATITGGACTSDTSCAVTTGSYAGVSTDGANGLTVTITNGAGSGTLASAYTYFPANLLAWWRGDLGVTASGSNVTTWADESGNSANATATANWPTTGATVGGQAALAFSGTEALQLPTIGATGAKALGVVYQFTSTPASSVTYNVLDIKNSAPSFSDIVPNNVGAPYLAMSFIADDSTAAASAGWTTPAANTSGHALFINYNGGGNATLGNYAANYDNATSTLAASGNLSRTTTDLGSIGGAMTSAGAVSGGLIGSVAEAWVWSSQLTTGGMTTMTTYTVGRYGF